MLAKICIARYFFANLLHLPMTKFLIIPATVILLFVYSCKKKSSSPSGTSGTITATVNGSPQTFNNILIAKDTTATGIYIITISGATSLTSNTTELGITIDGDSAIIKETYFLNSGGNSNDLPGLAYTVGSTTVYETDVSGADQTTITITSISANNVQGTFSGVLPLITGSGSSTATITNGVFNVNFK